LHALHRPINQSENMSFIKTGMSRMNQSVIYVKHVNVARSADCPYSYSVMDKVKN